MTSRAGWGWPIGSRMRTNMPGDSRRTPVPGRLQGLAKTPRTEMLPVVGLTWLLTKLMSPVRETVLALQAHQDRDLPALAGTLDLALVDGPADPQHGGLVDVEVGVHRVERDDGGQQGLVLVDQVAERVVIAADLAVDGRRDLGEVKVELVDLELAW